MAQGVLVALLIKQVQEVRVVLGAAEAVEVEVVVEEVVEVVEVVVEQCH